MANLLSGAITVLACCEGNAELPQRSLDHKTSSPVPVYEWGFKQVRSSQQDNRKKISMQVISH
jgi:hypothetical protein